MVYRIAAVLILASLPHLSYAQDKEPVNDPWPKLRSRGGELYYADSVLRSLFAKSDPKALPSAKFKLPLASASSFDWSTQVKPGRIFYQKDPNCWAFGVLAAFEWNWAIRNGGPIPDLTIQPILDQCQEGGTDAGGTCAMALSALLERGTCPATAYPYVGKPGKLRDKIPLNYRAIAWGDVSPGDRIPKPEIIKRALLEHGPLVVSVWTTTAFTQYKKGEVFKEHHVRPKGARLANHNLVIVGWDDAKGKGAWKAQNSWGPRWGDGGFIWIEYGCNYIGQETFWVRAQATQYQLPEKAHEQVTSMVVPFPTWPKARAIPLPAEPERPVVSVAEALKKPGERVIVQFQPRAYGPVSPQGHFMLSSQRDIYAEGCLVVWLLKSGLDRFPAQDVDGLWKLYRGKQIRIHGEVSTYALGNRVIQLIEVTRPEQIEVVK